MKKYYEFYAEISGHTILSVVADNLEEAKRLVKNGECDKEDVQYNIDSINFNSAEE